MTEPQTIPLEVAMGGVVWNRRQLLKSGLSLVAFSTLAGCSALPLAQQSSAPKTTRLPRIGYLAYATVSSTTLFYVRQGLRNLGYVENENFTVELRYSDRLDELTRYAADLVDHQVDAILAADTPSIRAAQQATDAIPIVMLTSADPIGNGFIKSLARPGGNITGVTQNKAMLSAKRLELLKDVVGSTSRVAVLWDPDDEGTTNQWRESQNAADRLGVHVDPVEVRKLADVVPALQGAARSGADALVLFSGLAIALSQVSEIVEAIIELRRPAIFDGRLWAAAGGLMSYGPSLFEQFQRAATYIDKILQGARPADLPVEQPTAIEFVVNWRTARAIGLTFPRSTLEQATEVIQ